MRVSMRAMGLAEQVWQRTNLDRFGVERDQEPHGVLEKKERERDRQRVNTHSSFPPKPPLSIPPHTYLRHFGLLGMHGVLPKNVGAHEIRVNHQIAFDLGGCVIQEERGDEGGSTSSM